jgi:hypothetical protein
MSLRERISPGARSFAIEVSLVPGAWNSMLFFAVARCSIKSSSRRGRGRGRLGLYWPAANMRSLSLVPPKHERAGDVNA